MIFFVRKEEIESTLNVIRESKALIKGSEEENLSSILIECDCDKQEVSFIATNLHIWAYSHINDKTFNKFDSVNVKDFFYVEESGKCFINGNEFIKIISGYPQTSILEFSLDKSGEGSSGCLRMSTKGKRGKLIKNTFSLREPSFFEKEPEKEETVDISIPSRTLYNSVNSVEFCSGCDDKSKMLWGIQVEAYGREIATMATDRKRIAFYDIRGLNRESGEKNVTFCPIKVPFFSALKGLDLDLDVDVKIGEKRTILEQENQKHIIPNVLFSDFKMPDWRHIAKQIDGQEISVSRKSLDDCIKRAALSTNSFYAIKILFDFDEKTLEISLQKTEDDGNSPSKFYETIPLEEEFCSGSGKQEFAITIDSIRDIINRNKSERLSFKIKDGDSPILIKDAEENFGYITATIK